MRQGVPREHPGSAEGTPADPPGGTRRTRPVLRCAGGVEPQGPRHFAPFRAKHARGAAVGAARRGAPRPSHHAADATLCVALRRSRRCSGCSDCNGLSSVKSVCLQPCARSAPVRSARVRACVRACRARRRWPARVGRADAAEVLPVSECLSAHQSHCGTHRQAPFERSGAQVAAGFTPIQRSFVRGCVFVRVCVSVRVGLSRL